MPFAHAHAQGDRRVGEYKANIALPLGMEELLLCSFLLYVGVCVWFVRRQKCI